MTKKEWALWYITTPKWKIIPLNYITDEGHCSCHLGEKCPVKNQGKHPIHSDYFSLASDDEKTIKKWWDKYPEANIGVMCGLNGLVVVDCDEGGEESLETLFDQYEQFPPTAEVETGSGGSHRYFFQNGHEIGRVIKFKPGLDVLGHKAFVVAPPSESKKGSYKWNGKNDVTEIPSWFAGLMTKKEKTRVAGEIYDGDGRDDSLISAAGSFRNMGYSEPEIYELLKARNTHYHPAKTEDDLRRISKSAAKYPIKRAPTSEPVAPLESAPSETAYPLECLGPIISAAAKEMSRIIESPEAIVGNSALGAVSLVAQKHFDININGRVFPPSLFLLSIAESGERKTGVDRVFLRPHRTYQEGKMEEYKSKQKTYQRDLAQYKARLKEKKSVLTHINEPLPPKCPILLIEEPTFEGLVRLFREGSDNVGLFVNEGGRFFSGHALSKEKRMHTLGGLSNLWDGQSLSVVRANPTQDLDVIYDKRIAIHIMAQTEVTKSFLREDLVKNQGFLWRCLAVWPKSKMGERKDIDENPYLTKEFQEYERLISNLLNKPAKSKRSQATLSPEAKVVYREFFAKTERELGPEGRFSAITGFGSKLSDMAARIACVLQAGNGKLDPGGESLTISPDYMTKGCFLADYYAGQWLNVLDMERIDTTDENATVLWDWLKKKELKKVSYRDIRNHAPNKLRDKDLIIRAMEELERLGWVVDPDGKQRRWDINSEVRAVITTTTFAATRQQ